MLLLEDIHWFCQKTLLIPVKLGNIQRMNMRSRIIQKAHIWTSSSFSHNAYTLICSPVASVNDPLFIIIFIMILYILSWNDNKPTCLHYNAYVDQHSYWTWVLTATSQFGMWTVDNDRKLICVCTTPSHTNASIPPRLLLVGVSLIVCTPVCGGLWLTTRGCFTIQGDLECDLDEHLSRPSRHFSPFILYHH